MAEFNDVIKQFKRMCRYTNRSGLPNECPLYCKGHGCNISHCRLLAFDDKKFAKVVMDWAAEHPEPVYPTWFEVLENMGIAGYINGEPYYDSRNRKVYLKTPAFTPKAFDPIPADTAQKLGIEQKEG